jgi:hypothetical protein
VFGDESAGEYGLFVLWNSPDSASAASSVIHPMLEERLAGNIQGALDARLYKVLSK